MKIYQNKYTEIVRVEIKNLKTKEIRSVSYCQTTLEEVISHVQKTLRTGLLGIKVRINIRISDPKKRWGAQQNFTVCIEDLDAAIIQITTDVPKLK